MKFLSKMWHPNSVHSFDCSPLVYEDGSVCISILHTPGVDMFNEFVRAILPVVSHRNREKRGGDPFSLWRRFSSVCRTCYQSRTRTHRRISTLPLVLCLLFTRRSSTVRIGNSSRSVSGERCRIRWKRSGVRIGNSSRSVSGERCRIRWKRSGCVFCIHTLITPIGLILE